MLLSELLNLLAILRSTDSNNVGTVAVWDCMHWWYSCQMVKEGRNGVISTQSVLIVSTWCWWAAAAPCEMTMVYVLECLLWLVLWGTWIQPERTETGMYVLLLFHSFGWSLSNLVGLSLLLVLLTICLIQYHSLSASVTDASTFSPRSTFSKSIFVAVSFT